MLLDRRSFLVKERVAFLKLTDRYDIFDTDSGEQIGFAQEEVSSFVKLLRFFIAKQLMPTTIGVKEDDSSEPVVTMKRGMTFLQSRVEVLDQSLNSIGFFKSKLFSFGGGFTVHSKTGEQVADVKGNWKGWEFQLLDMQGNLLGTVNKKWAGAIKEIFTSADNYVISLSDQIETNAGLAGLLLAAGLAIDIVFKEKA